MVATFCLGFILGTVFFAAVVFCVVGYVLHEEDGDR